MGSMQPSSVEFLSKVLPNAAQSCLSMPSEQVPLDSTGLLYKTNTNVSSSSSSGYESNFSHSSKSDRSWFSRIKRLINFPSSKKANDYQLSPGSVLNESTHSPRSPIVHPRNSNFSNSISNNDTRRNSLTRLDIRRKSARRTLAPATQHVPFLYGLKNCGNTWLVEILIFY